MLIDDFQFALITHLRLSKLVDIHWNVGEVGIKVSCAKFKVEVHKRRFKKTAVYFKMATSSNPLSLIVQVELLTVRYNQSNKKYYKIFQNFCLIVILLSLVQWFTLKRTILNIILRIQNKIPFRPYFLILHFDIIRFYHIDHITIDRL